jgi:uncharacterized protein
MKYLLLMAVVLVLWWGFKKHQPRSGAELPKDKPSEQPEKMVMCAHCGVHHPLGESFFEGETAYCSAAHRLAGKPSGRP